MKFIKNILLVLILFFINFIIVNFLPSPFNQISIIALIIIGFLLFESKNLNIVYFFMLIFLIELFSGLPFGVGLISAISVIYIMKWILNNILTNRSMYIVILAATITTIMYRLIFFALLYIFNFFLGQTTILSNNILINAGWELGMTVIVASLLYISLYRLAKKINPTYIFK